LTSTIEMPATIDDVQKILREQHYISDRSLAVPIFLSLKLQRPLFLEGEAGVGKTEIARALAAALDTELIHLQCYEGLDINHAVYEWNHTRQILEIRLMESSGQVDRESATADLFSERFLIKRRRPSTKAARSLRSYSSTSWTGPMRSSRDSCWRCWVTSRSRFQSWVLTKQSTHPSL